MASRSLARTKRASVVRRADVGAGLGDVSLERLRRALAVLSTPGRGLPLDAVLEVAHAVPPDLSLTVDVEASRVLGAPLVVVRPRPGEDVLSLLSPREREVALLVADGARNAEIARRFGLKLSTVKDHVHRVLEKTGFESRAELAAAVVRSAPSHGGQR